MIQTSAQQFSGRSFFQQIRELLWRENLATGYGQLLAKSEKSKHFSAVKTLGKDS